MIHNVARCTVCSLVVVALAVPTIGAAEGQEKATQSSWETIRPDFSNVRGLNYIASYAPSDVAMWRFYDRDQIDWELGYIKALGANSILNWDDVELTPENIVEHRGLLRWTFISLAWGGALGDHLAEAQQLNLQADAAQKDGDSETLEATLSKLAHMAAKLLVEHHFVAEDGTPIAYPE